MHKLDLLWSELRASLWFVPGLIVAASLALAAALVEVDGRVSRELLAEYPRLFGAGAEGSRGMLGAIAGSMITVAGVTFSISSPASSERARAMRSVRSKRSSVSIRMQPCETSEPMSEGRAASWIR